MPPDYQVPEELSVLLEVVLVALETLVYEVQMVLRVPRVCEDRLEVQGEMEILEQLVRLARQVNRVLMVPVVGLEQLERPDSPVRLVTRGLAADLELSDCVEVLEQPDRAVQLGLKVLEELSAWLESLDLLVTPVPLECPELREILELLELPEQLVKLERAARQVLEVNKDQPASRDR